MQYKGKYSIFDTSQIITYPLPTRKNKVKFADLIFPEQINDADFNIPVKTRELIKTIAQSIVTNRKMNRPVILFAGAHLIKNGLGPLVVDLVKQNCVTLVAGNAATAIHDFELAQIGQTSEDVPAALGRGQFGMAHEFIFINAALSVGNRQQLGFGESLGRMISDETFRRAVLAFIKHDESANPFSYPTLSVLAACEQTSIPFTVHAGIGMDVIDQHPSFDGEAKGGCSGRDFLIYAHEATKFTSGGCILNIGSAVHGPEVLLKALSVAANIGQTPHNIVVADFDLRAFDAGQMTDESSEGYYFRDQKSVVTRVPDAFAGVGYYVQGNQKETFPFLYKQIVSFSQ